jgi:hypothetical protein
MSRIHNIDIAYLANRTPSHIRVLWRVNCRAGRRRPSVGVNAFPCLVGEALLREAERKLAGELFSGRPSGTLRSRVLAASELLNEQLGAVTHVEQNGGRDPR